MSQFSFPQAVPGYLMDILNGLLDVIFPDRCLLCEIKLESREAHLMCPHCWAALPRNVTACCRCAQRLSINATCGACQQNTFVSGNTIAPFDHRDEAKYLVHRFKYHHDFRAGRALATFIALEVRRAYQEQPLPQALIPVPLSYRRQVYRGYNQAAWLSRSLSKELGIAVVQRGIARKHGPTQRTLARAARLKLAKNTFHLSVQLPYQHVAIIDDVLTTGATCKSLARLLEAQGIKRVDVWCATRTQPSP